ncbi:MAG: response regulator transcription factor [Candidatus Marinimicrobia bacterium]|jgi:DNA-binding NarL/FixJ family response regulator|nr:response regulator transcription factor [Candidatus Neomarinimicrobiota bacterium]MBT3633873.1 response regulator transcription factor [Candidatus Neomarinimicrobiota bacterium]MBT3682877.1 response regulator transcription factor [Candidatus Neomarinimicrobiota bacterium]MBT3759936.1 response regulator transcription factor [Candidatus Neomarinimicrobiota bacterium]MBT3896030.1 response regulator transcription factor [Candidatus Neomarinimicrobiota bacterium]
MSIKIILADDHKIVREGLISLLNQQDDMKVLADAAEGFSIIKFARKFKPDVVITDISMPELNGIEATEVIHKEFPKMKIIALSMHSEKHVILRVLRAGANGYLLKDSAFLELVKAIRSVLKGEIYLSSKITDMVVNEYIKKISENESDLDLLSVREKEVLQLISEGKSTKEIAALLFVSIKTIESHRKHLMEKLGLFTVADLTRFAIKEGLIFIED